LWDRADVADAAGRYDQPVTKDELLAHCLSKPGAWQDEPWEGDTVVKVGPKIFAFLGSGDGAATHGSVGVKCAATRDAADEWLKLYPDDASVMAYIGRSGWNTLRFGGSIPRRRGARRGRRVLPNDRGQAAQERPPRLSATREKTGGSTARIANGLSRARENLAGRP
jgi:predicted DNA-binding protein (MmcQ/YjbR family)